MQHPKNFPTKALRNDVIRLEKTQLENKIMPESDGLAFVGKIERRERRLKLG